MVGNVEETTKSKLDFENIRPLPLQVSLQSHSPKTDKRALPDHYWSPR